MSEIENTTVATPVVLTKEERLAKIDKEIARLTTKRYNIENDIVEVKAKKEVVLPEVGADVLFNYGRRTATTEPVQKIGRVVAVKPASVNDAGKKLPAQIKVSVGEGFEQEFVVIYPAQIADAGPAAE
jgi:chorismate mutase